MLVRIQITETFVKEITVEAENADGAEQDVIDRYEMHDIRLAEEDFRGATIKCQSYCPKIAGDRHNSET